MIYKKKIIEVGNRIFLEHLNHSHSGNISIRINDFVYITRSGAQLGFLNYDDIIKLNINQQYSANASMEYIVHKSIYLNSNATAIVHAHPVHTIALSFSRDRIQPIDAEGIFYFPEGVPVLSVENAIASDEVAEKIPQLFLRSTAVIVKGHGIFCIGKNIEEAYKFASSIESSSKIISLV